MNHMRCVLFVLSLSSLDKRIQELPPEGAPATELNHTAITLGAVLDESLQSSVATSIVRAILQVRGGNVNISAMRWERGNDEATAWPGQQAKDAEVLRPDGCLSAIFKHGQEPCCIPMVRRLHWLLCYSLSSLGVCSSMRRTKSHQRRM